jgi:hypothetical protein
VIPVSSQPASIPDRRGHPRRHGRQVIHIGRSRSAWRPQSPGGQSLPQDENGAAAITDCDLSVREPAVMVAYLYRDGVFWTNCTGRKKRVTALRARPGSAVVIGKDGQTAIFKVTSVVHNRDDHDWEQLTR